MKEHANPPLNIDCRWQAIVDRDKQFDGQFLYSVKTTGVYCRPSCGARLAKYENVQFHQTCEEAEFAGFRACKRCKPKETSHLENHLVTVSNICRLIETSERKLSLQEMASSAGLSPYHFHRIFKSITGLTPMAYATAHRAKRIRQELSNSSSVTQAIFDAGYNSSGRFYEESGALLGMTPTAYKAGGENTTIYFAIGDCFLGSILVAQSSKGVCAILMGDDPGELLRDLQDRFPRAELKGGDQDFEQVIAQVISYIEEPGQGLSLPLDIRGTSFQQRVWQALREIPPGQTRNYTDIGKKIGAPKAVRAVASACAANALAVVIPCHRVVRSDGSLSGYRWGVERKRTLIELEAAKTEKPIAKNPIANSPIAQKPEA
jgi:AraC family transcriptional regulator of adaptative response/methylated-DNA-[protein]-cysteine methyltransferase